MHKITLQRFNGKKISDDKALEQVTHLLERGISGARGNGWRYDVEQKKTFRSEAHDKWVFTFVAKFEKTRGKMGDVKERQWEEIFTVIQKTGTNSIYAKYPWKVVSHGKDDETPLPGSQESESESTDIHVKAEENPIIVKESPKPDKDDDKVSMEDVGSWDEIHIPEELLASDEALNNHPYFRHIYGVNPQIRTLLSSVKSGADSNGQQRDHCVLWGHAGCGKTTTLLALEQLLGPRCILRLDATSTSRAGIEELVFEKYEEYEDVHGRLTKMPPVVLCEEIEKADEGGLQIWLGALDSRGEVRKNKFRRTKMRKVRILFICTVNNKRKFDMMMGSDGTEAGALSSRCVTEIYFPRPKRDVLRRILQDRIEESGGDLAWIEPALNLGSELGYSDPRKYRSLLAGGERLLTGEYQADRLAIFNAAKEEN